jgi:hypothetical protein
VPVSNVIIPPDLSVPDSLAGLPALIQTIESNPPFNRLRPGVHGSTHARRVLLFSHLIAASIRGQWGTDPVNERLLTIAALLHDCGRENDGFDPEHADRSAELAVEFCRLRGIECDSELLRNCIRYHCKSERFVWRNPRIEARILADADKLDRFRFHRLASPLNASRLELGVSHSLIPLAADVNAHPCGR